MAWVVQTYTFNYTFYSCFINKYCSVADSFLTSGEEQRKDSNEKKSNIFHILD